MWEREYVKDRKYKDLGGLCLHPCVWQPHVCPRSMLWITTISACYYKLDVVCVYVGQEVYSVTELLLRKGRYMKVMTSTSCSVYPVWIHGEHLTVVCNMCQGRYSQDSHVTCRSISASVFLYAAWAVELVMFLVEDLVHAGYICGAAWWLQGVGTGVGVSAWSGFPSSC